ncbi:hypothetical protein KUTeg_009532 [Tegillarca granosa]|uniref:Cytochrome P450 n=1 Tax=Tegillarca granosa TaxID=220873 RepID=A0ABQ9F446_TEGGR|nr:hypothetical protein KUTeg_009532 [Tegillarca granosa]
MDQSILDILTLYTDMCLGFLIVLAVLIIYTLYSVINHAVAIYLDSEIPGPFAFPLIGNLFDVAFVKEEDRFAFHQNLRMKYGDIYRLYLGRKKIIYLHNYDLIREMLVEKKNIFGEKPGCYPVLSGHGIMFSNGKQFKIFKEIALSAIYKRGFKKDAMEAIMHDEVGQVIDYIKMTKGQGLTGFEAV